MKKILPWAVVTALTAFSCMKDGEAYYGYYDGGDAPDAALSGDRFDEIAENPFVDAGEKPVSTFSVDADGAAYAYMRRCVLQHGLLPSAHAVRIEEYLNYFTFDYPAPTVGKGVALNAEVGVCPWAREHRLMRLGIKGRELAADQVPQANFVFLIDISGSMSSTDKLPLLKTGLITMLDYMRPDDRVAIVTYASGEKLLLPSTPVSEKETIVGAIRKLNAAGATSGARAMQMAYDEAVKHYIEGANNRIIMGTDGDFNVGVTSTDALVEMVENYAAKGIYLTVCGFGTGNLNDSMMERISNSGNGTYEYIDSEEEMTKVFVNERSRFVAVANDCKVQVTFNPEVVAQYRLIGYENRVMNQSDFDNDEKDAAEIGAGQTVTALYEIVPAEKTEGTYATFDFRYKETLGGESILLSHEIVSDGRDHSENFDFAAGIAAYGLTLRDSQYKGDATATLAAELVGASIGTDPYGLRAQFKQILDTVVKMGR
ncbi:MAG: von Willebrand factor type A domain-containing protein [Bacteroidales bacterium]|nr:von Willebrand factor type A domain-containing protein [Bacteroidales bacterium]